MRFLYAASHDLKSPLVTVSTFLGYLEKDLKKASAQEAVDKDLEFIRNATAKMSQRLDEVLELSRVGRQANVAVEISLQDIINEALHLIAGRLATAGVVVQITDEPLLLYGDRPRLVEVIQNLVDNAAKFMGNQPNPQVTIGVHYAPEGPVVFVRDNGIGVDPRHQGKLFGMFEKIDPHSEGTGMGLALVKRIVEVHGGKIWVESEGIGLGTTFKFTLARARRVLNKEWPS
jgi:signal transduction histidine kinase